MDRSNEQSRGTRSVTERTPSFGHLLLVWLLVGPSLWSLGSSVADATQVELPLSTIGVGLLFGTIIVVLFWTAGFQPSLAASFGYFVAEQAIDLILLFGAVLIPGRSLIPRLTVALQLVSICLAATLVFTPIGTQVRNWLRRYVRSLLELPPQDPPADHD